MTVHRIMGLETEYGILAPTDQHSSPMLLSGLVVSAYGAAMSQQSHRSKWDYQDEAPLRDARGYTVPRAQAHPTQLTDRGVGCDDEDIATANVVLTNGARLYVDHAHPEYSSPEVTNPLDAVLYDRAGEVIMQKAAELASGINNGHEIRVYKNNTDNKGASYGTHENYLMPREVPFHAIVSGLLPFFASRLVITGNGSVGIGMMSQTPGFQISQRADYMEVEVGLETTLKRPLVNTRDEPHAAAERYRRLHVILGDANLCEMATFLKMGTTSLVLSLIESGRAPQIELANPVQALQQFSRDPSLQVTAKTVAGETLTALDLQWAYYEAVDKMLTEECPADPGQLTALTMSRWHDVLTKLGQDPMLCAQELDWVAKLRVMQGFIDRDNLAWDAPRIELLDVQYADMRPRQGVFGKLQKAGKVRTLVSADQVQQAITEPPTDTRAYFRGRCLREFGSHVVAASWDSVVLDVPGSSALHRIPMMDPYRGTQAHVAQLFDGSTNVAQFVAQLTGR